MARSKFVIEDSFDAIFRDLERVSLDAADVMRAELGQAVADIVGHTPVATGMAASAWAAAARALGAKHKPITPVPIQVNKSTMVSALTGKKGHYRLIDNRAKGRRMGGYREKLTGKKGKRVNRATFEAFNSVYHIKFIEYGISLQAGGGIHASAATGEFLSGVVRGYHFARQPEFQVRNAVRRMKQRIGPEFSKALKANIRRPKRYKTKTVRG